jgi:hypothetical protein
MAPLWHIYDAMRSHFLRHVCHGRHRPRRDAEGGAPDVVSGAPPSGGTVAGAAYLASRLKTDFDQK